MSITLHSCCRHALAEVGRSTNTPSTPGLYLPEKRLSSAAGPDRKLSTMNMPGANHKPTVLHIGNTARSSEGRGSDLPWSFQCACNEMPVMPCPMNASSVCDHRNIQFRHTTKLSMAQHLCGFCVVAGPEVPHVHSVKNSF